MQKAGEAAFARGGFGNAEESKNGVSQRSYLEELVIGGHKRKVRLGIARKTGRSLLFSFLLLDTWTILIMQQGHR